MGFYDTLSVILAPIAVLVMILLSRNGWKIAARFGGNRRSSGTLAMESSLVLDTRRRLSVITWEGQRFLLLTGGPNDLVVSGTYPLSTVEENDT